MYGFIYETTNNINGMKYIGQKTYDKKGNWKTYLGSGIHLKRAIDKYGKENFSRKILEECVSKEILDEREIYWIKYFDAVNSNNYYNIASGGDGGNTIQGFSTERLDKLKKLHSEKLIHHHQNRDEDFNSKLTKDIVVNIVIPRLKNNEFNSDIAKELNVSPRTIDDIRHHKTWKKYTKDIVFDDISNRKRGRKPKKIVQYSLKGDRLKEYNSAIEAGNDVNADSKMIMDVCSGNTRQCRGYIWRYENDPFDKYDITNYACVKIDKYSKKDGQYICTYDSINEANESIDSGDVRSVLCGQAKSAGGYFWCRHDEEFIVPIYGKQGRKKKIS